MLVNQKWLTLVGLVVLLLVGVIVYSALQDQKGTDTSSVDLDMDILTSIVLLDSAGEEVSPVSWDGDPPEGHHRTGTLSFAALNPKPETVTVLAKNIADVPLREFVWKK